MLRKPIVPDVLKRQERGATIFKVWTFLYLNQNTWFTSKDIASQLGIPLVSVQVALKKLRGYPEIVSDREKPWRGRPKRKYKFGKIEYDFRV
jgi:predicted ArsR family transcriptional regulator